MPATAIQTGSVKFTTSNAPHPSKLIESLRSNGYTIFTAVKDLIDNSLDAGATEIKLYVIPVRGDFRIILADNGEGMNKETLDEAMRLGTIRVQSRAKTWVLWHGPGDGQYRNRADSGCHHAGKGQ